MSEPPIDPPVEEEIIDGWNTAPVSGDRLDVNENSFIAGDPAGARIEIRSTGFHAFNGVGTETAHIDGGGGVINGGSFATAFTSGTRIYMNNTARHGVWPGIAFQTPGLQRAAAIAVYDGSLSADGTWPNGTIVMWSGLFATTSPYSDVSSGPEGAALQTRGPGAGSSIRTDNIGGAQMEGKLGNRVLASDLGSAELQSSGGSSVLADNLGNARIRSTLGNLVTAGSNGTSTVSSSAGSSVSAFVSGGAQMTSAGGGLFVAHSAGESSMWANNTERIRATSTGVNITGVLNVGTTDVMAYIAGLEARIAALEA